MPSIRRAPTQRFLMILGTEPPARGSSAKKPKNYVFLFLVIKPKTRSVFWLSGTAPQSWSGKPKNTKRFLVFWSKNKKNIVFFGFLARPHCAGVENQKILEKTKKTNRKKGAPATGKPKNTKCFFVFSRSKNQKHQKSLI